MLLGEGVEEVVFGDWGGLPCMFIRGFPADLN